MNLKKFQAEVSKQDAWADELKRWEDSHPSHQPFKEDSDSQRRLNNNTKGAEL